jgi:hypothetical protein
MYIIFNAANTLIDDANNDEELRERFESLDSYVRKVCPLVLFLFASFYVLSCRSFFKQATSLSPTATTVATKFATSVVSSTT